MDKVKVQQGKATALPKKEKPKVAGVIPSPDAFRATAKGSRFVLTSAQNNTKVHRGFWTALERFAIHNKAQIMVSRFSYNKNAWLDAGGITKDAEKVDGEDIWYAPEVIKHAQDENIQLAEGLVFCAELDILPTAKDPLSGFDNFTGTNSLVVPHAKTHMRSYAGLLSGQPQRFGYTTGAVTLRNYIDRKAGQIASYHHVYGALYVEVDARGRWFARQIIAADDGSFFDLDTYYHAKGNCKIGSENFLSFFPNAISVVNLGDIHAEKLDATVFASAMQMLDVMKPTHVAIHDLLDFEARNHHNLKDPFFWADQHFNGMNTVQANFNHAVVTLGEVQRHVPHSKLLLVRSNHDEAFTRWLKEFDPVRDPANARFYHYHMWLRYQAIENGETYDNYQWALSEAADAMDVRDDDWVHIKEDDSYVLHNIEFGLHGHLGPNGSRGNPKAYRQLGRKLNTGHTHSAGIIDGVWTAGVLASLRMGYNKGPSSWSHSHILTHANGKRQIVTQYPEDGAWRA